MVVLTNYTDEPADQAEAAVRALILDRLGEDEEDSYFMPIFYDVIFLAQDERYRYYIIVNDSEEDFIARVCQNRHDEYYVEVYEANFRYAPSNIVDEALIHVRKETDD